MRVRLVVLVICLSVLLASAAPGGKKDKKGRRPGGEHGKRPDHGPGGRQDTGRGRPDHGPGGRPDQGPGGRPDRGQGGRPDRGQGGRPDRGHGGRPDTGHGRPVPGEHHERPGTPDRGPSGRRDPRCDNLDCPKGTRDSYVCGTDGQTYKSACHLLKDQCTGKITADIEVYDEGRCQHPAEAGEPQGHPDHGPGRHTPGHHGKHPGGRTPHGHHGPGGRTPGGTHPGGRTPGGHRGHHDHHDHHDHGHHGFPPRWWPRWRPSWWPEECWDIFDDIFNTTDPMTTDMPVTAPDYAVDGELPAGPACTATCPLDTLDNPLQPVCGSNDRTYESSCILELVACVTDNYELTVAYEAECLDVPVARNARKRQKL